MRNKNLKEITTGLPREVIEYLESNTELANTAINAHKTDFKNNFLYILIGFIFSISGTIAIELIKESDTELMNRQLHEINASYDSLNIEFQHMHSEIELLKKQIDSLKN